MTTITARRADTAAYDQASRLLRRYPDVTPEERRELIHFLKDGPPDDVARLTFGSGLDDRITALKKDHPGDFATGPKILLPFLAFMIGAVAVLLLVRTLLI